jgi:hypothetical protein
MPQIERELLQGVQETMTKVSRSSSKECSHDLVIFSGYNKHFHALLGGKEHGSCNKAISSGITNCNP